MESVSWIHLLITAACPLFKHYYPSASTLLTCLLIRRLKLEQTDNIIVFLLLRNKSGDILCFSYCQQTTRIYKVSSVC